MTTEQQYTEALALIKLYTSKLEQLKQITRSYIYSQEAIRVVERKIDSDAEHNRGG